MWQSIRFQIGLWNGWLFMMVFILKMIVMAFADKKIQERTKVPKDARKTFVEKNIRYLVNFICFAALIYSVFLPLYTGTFWFYAGLLFFLPGILTMAAGTAAFMTTPPDQMIRKGIYGFSRHPLYLSTILVYLGTAIASTSWLFLAVTLILIIGCHLEALLEEKVCVEKYGDAYRSYMQEVPRWAGIIK